MFTTHDKFVNLVILTRRELVCLINTGTTHTLLHYLHDKKNLLICINAPGGHNLGMEGSEDHWEETISQAQSCFLSHLQ